MCADEKRTDGQESRDGSFMITRLFWAVELCIQTKHVMGLCYHPKALYPIKRTLSGIREAIIIFE